MFMQSVRIAAAFCLAGQKNPLANPHTLRYETGSYNLVPRRAHHRQLLAFVFGMGVPVAPYDGGNDDAALDLQLVDFAGDVSIDVQPLSDDEISSAARAGILPDLYVKSVTVIPLVEKAAEPGAHYRIDSLGRKVDCTDNKMQFADFQYSAATVSKIRDIIKASWPDGSVRYVGWYIESELYCLAEYPEYVEVTPSANHIDGPDTYRIAMVRPNTSCIIKGKFWEPADKADSYYHVGFSGAFYFMRSTGLSGFAYAVGLSANADKL